MKTIEQVRGEVEAAIKAWHQGGIGMHVNDGRWTMRRFKEWKAVIDALDEYRDLIELNTTQEVCDIEGLGAVCEYFELCHHENCERSVGGMLDLLNKRDELRNKYERRYM